MRRLLNRSGRDHPRELRSKCGEEGGLFVAFISVCAIVMFAFDRDDGS